MLFTGANRNDRAVVCAEKLLEVRPPDVFPEDSHRGRQRDPLSGSLGGG